ncbi:hypothetical protein [Parafrankia soli]|uniref:hypothetical protein n=1 Tax=Parafrankia soli TaxID=2599596 RepID=UPI001F529053|nr:hypothetical protein [Parafrankia soli]
MVFVERRGTCADHLRVGDPECLPHHGETVDDNAVQIEDDSMGEIKASVSAGAGANGIESP